VHIDGGGLNFYTVVTSTLRGNRIENNVGAGSMAASGGADPNNGGAGGGGFNMNESTALLQSNIISGNISDLHGNGGGGA